MSAPYRDPQTEQAIADARGPVETPDFDDARPVERSPDDEPDPVRVVPVPVYPADFGPAIDLGPLPTMEQMRDRAPRTVLTGESHEAYAEFTAAAQALEAHQRSATPVLERYKTALAKLSGIAARSGG